jgi:3-oxoacyl-[acyl-carrier protein] reductase
VVSSLGFPNASVYSGTKGAVDSITRSLAKERGPCGIRVNAINPGMLETEGTQSAGIAESEMRKQVKAQRPLARIGKPQDIADAASMRRRPSATFPPRMGAAFRLAGGKPRRRACPSTNP